MPMASRSPMGETSPLFHPTPASQTNRPRKRVRMQAPTSSGPASQQKRRQQTTPHSSTPPVPVSDNRPYNLQEEPLEEHEEEDDSLNEVMMAIDMRNRDTIGCAYYVARNETLYMLSDVKYGGLEIIENCKFQSCHPICIDVSAVRIYAEPTVVLISTKVDETVDDYLNPEKYAQEGQDHDR